MSFANPQNPTAAGFIGSFISVNGAPLSQHYAKVSRIITEIEQVPINVAPQLLDEAKNHAQAVVPVRTGFLRSSIDWEQISRYIYHFFAKAGYAAPVEFGTFRMAARPYMSPAVAILKQKAPQVIIKQVNRIFS